jgi:hypothetical protein
MREKEAKRLLVELNSMSEVSNFAFLKVLIKYLGLEQQERLLLIDLKQVHVVVIVHHYELIEESPGKEEAIFNCPDGRTLENVNDLRE